MNSGKKPVKVWSGNRPLLRNRSMAVESAELFDEISELKCFCSLKLALLDKMVLVVLWISISVDGYLRIKRYKRNVFHDLGLYSCILSQALSFRSWLLMSLNTSFKFVFLISCFWASIVSIHYSGAYPTLTKICHPTRTNRYYQNVLRYRSGLHSRGAAGLCKSTVNHSFSSVAHLHRRKIPPCAPLVRTCSRSGIATGYLITCFFIRDAFSGCTGQTMGHLSDTHHDEPGDVLLLSW